MREVRLREIQCFFQNYIVGVRFLFVLGVWGFRSELLGFFCVGEIGVFGFFGFMFSSFFFGFDVVLVFYFLNFLGQIIFFLQGFQQREGVDLVKLRDVVLVIKCFFVYYFLFFRFVLVWDGFFFFVEQFGFSFSMVFGGVNDVQILRCYWLRLFL